MADHDDGVSAETGGAPRSQQSAYYSAISLIDYVMINITIIKAQKKNIDIPIYP